MHKCVSLTHFTGGHNDYKAGAPGGPLLTAPDGPGGAEVNWSMQKELTALRAPFLSLWVNWYDLAQGFGRPPTSYEESARMLDGSFGWAGGRPRDLAKPLIQYLDETIKLANNTPRWDATDPNDPAQRVGVILTVYQGAPTWSWTTDANPRSEDGTGKDPSRHFPNDLGAESPYGWFIRWLVARYSGGVVANPGPSAGGVNGRGNPLGAKVHVLQPLNEPNFEWWPQTFATCSASTAMTTCEYWCRYYMNVYGTYPIWTLGPGGSDKTRTVYEGDQPANTGYVEFTEAVLNDLAMWDPVAPVRWAHHNYKDIEEDDPDAPPGTGLPYAKTRVANLQTLLREGQFLGNARAPINHAARDIWLTEGTRRMTDYYFVPDRPDLPRSPQYKQDAQVEQSNKIANNFEQMRAHSTVVLWTQYLINDDSTAGDRTTYALREPWRDGSPGFGPGARRIAWHTLSRFLPAPPDVQP